MLFTEDAYSERFVEFTTGFGATSATVELQTTGLCHADSLSLGARVLPTRSGQMATASAARTLPAGT